MGEPVLRLVIPEPSGGRGQTPRWPASGQSSAGHEAAGEGGTCPPADGATMPATSTATEPEPGSPTVATAPATHAKVATTEDATAGTADGDAALPGLQPIGRPMTAGERAARLARHWAAAVRRDVMRPGELPHAIWHGKPESLAEIHAYAVSRAWVPDGQEGLLAPALGAVYSHTIAKGGVALGLFIAWVTARALRLATFAFVSGVLVVLIIAFG